MSEQIAIVRMTKSQRYIVKLLKQTVEATAAERGKGRKVNEWIVSQFAGDRVHVEIETSESDGDDVLFYAAIIGKRGALDFHRDSSDGYKPLKISDIKWMVL